MSRRKITKIVKAVPRRHDDRVTDAPGVRAPCFQCELDIEHVCFDGIPNAKWGVES